MCCIFNTAQLSLVDLRTNFEAENLTLICTTTGSPPTYTLWFFRDMQLVPTMTKKELIRNGDDVIFYHTTQTVVNRNLSLYENKLILSSNVAISTIKNATLILGTYGCSVSNAISILNASVINYRNLIIKGMLLSVTNAHVKIFTGVLY